MNGSAGQSVQSNHFLIKQLSEINSRFSGKREPPEHRKVVVGWGEAGLDWNSLNTEPHTEPMASQATWPLLTLSGDSSLIFYTDSSYLRHFASQHGSCRLSQDQKERILAHKAQPGFQWNSNSSWRRHRDSCPACTSCQPARCKGCSARACRELYLDAHLFSSTRWFSRKALETCKGPRVK